jgi:site-specific recombinase XerD
VQVPRLRADALAQPLHISATTAAEFSASRRDPVTRRAYSDVLTHYLAWRAAKNIAVDDLDPQHTHRFASDQAAARTAPATALRALSVTRQYTGYLLTGDAEPARPHFRAQPARRRSIESVARPADLLEHADPYRQLGRERVVAVMNELVRRPVMETPVGKRSTSGL